MPRLPSLFAAALGLVAAPLRAEEPEMPARVDATSAEGEWLLLPHFSYSPETSLAAGAAACFLYGDATAGPPGDARRPSLFRIAAAYSLRAQVAVSLGADLALADSRHRLRLLGRVARAPGLRFFGLGNDTRADEAETYLLREATLRTELLLRAFGPLGVGVRLEWFEYQVGDLDEEGALIRGDIPGSGGASTAGVGAVIAWDDRDDGRQPVRGGLYELSVTGHDLVLGGEFHFVRVQFDARRYQPVAPGHGLAFHGRAVAHSGPAPFPLLAGLGGPEILRGSTAAATAIATCCSPRWSTARRCGGASGERSSSAAVRWRGRWTASPSAGGTPPAAPGCATRSIPTAPSAACGSVWTGPCRPIAGPRTSRSAKRSEAPRRDGREAR